MRPSQQAETARLGGVVLASCFDMSVQMLGGLSATEVFRRTMKESSSDDIFGLAAQLSYYFFLALFPAILFLLAVASFFPLESLTDDLARTLGPFVSAEVIALIQEQMQRLANADSGGLLTFGVLSALWSSSAALVSIVGALNRAYDIEEGRPWWKVRLVAIALTIGVAIFVLCSLSLVLVGPSLAAYLGKATGWGASFEWAWLIVQWPLALLLVSTAIGLVYYFGPDADQDWAWITPGAVVATVLWLLVSLGFKLYVANFTDYNASYGAVGGVIVLLLWFYVSSLAILVGAEMNAEIEHASPYGKAPGQKSAAGKRVLGHRARARFEQGHSSARPADPGRETVRPAASVFPAEPRAAESPALGAVFATGVLLLRAWRRRRTGSSVDVSSEPGGRALDLSTPSPASKSS